MILDSAYDIIKKTCQKWRTLSASKRLLVQKEGDISALAHVEMMGLIGMGNNPMVGATVAVAVAVEEAMK